ncbi:pyridoxamine 5'-phosphate oxidase family protein [Mariniflexile gromovii]|uniref:Pyridoxamine 5'-phosphate oxidase family protein n=1 Tax=Mariniflexile gromovii TaxID=362523 RepID=A0ABS4BUE1_9FLAO|nr:pyridoxamine 5'-phosphate oxidase family protein [Mariniflexile gromovii]MBP0904199.1 pyridoxamine 5'-phosphate oxidase family protein [Mariniflexile gromovii]
MSKENLYNDEAKKKIKDMAEAIDFTMMATGLGTMPLHMIPMSTKKVDEEGVIWFLSNKNSTHNQNIIKDAHVHLIYVDKSAMQFLNVYGQAIISTDKSVIEELYGKADDTWFEGKHDPNITAISVKPTEAFYWDPKSNKLVTLVKIGVGAITGNEPDLMDQGKINL